MTQPTAEDLQAQIADLWRQTNSPRVTLFGLRALYRKIGELRQQLEDLETQPEVNR